MVRVARGGEEALSHLPCFVVQAMAYGSAADVQIAELFIAEEDFRSVLERARLARSRRTHGSAGTGPVASGFFDR
jgi:hypothetical protein